MAERVRVLDCGVNLGVGGLRPSSTPLRGGKTIKRGLLSEYTVEVGRHYKGGMMCVSSGLTVYEVHLYYQSARYHLHRRLLQNDIRRSCCVGISGR